MIILEKPVSCIQLMHMEERTYPEQIHNTVKHLQFAFFSADSPVLLHNAFVDKVKQ